MPSVLTLSPFSGDTGSRCSHAMFTTLSSSGMNNEHIPPYNNLSCIKYTFQSSRLPVNYMDYVNSSKFIIEPNECKNNSFKASNSKTIAFALKLKWKIHVWTVHYGRIQYTVTFIGYTHCNTAYYACLVNQLVVIMCFFDFDLDFCGVPISHTLVHPCPWCEWCPTRSHWTVTKGWGGGVWGRGLISKGAGWSTPKTWTWSCE